MLSRRQHRLQSSLQLFLEACRLWGETFENDELLCQTDEMERQLEQARLDECSEETVIQVEGATVQLINSMDNLLKAMGSPGFTDGSDPQSQAETFLRG
jgi:hypothetical protein